MKVILLGVILLNWKHSKNNFLNMGAFIFFAFGPLLSGKAQVHALRADSIFGLMRVWNITQFS